MYAALSLTNRNTKTNNPVENVMLKATPDDLGKIQDILQAWTKEILSRK